MGAGRGLNPASSGGALPMSYAPSLKAIRKTLTVHEGWGIVRVFRQYADVVNLRLTFL